MKRYKRVIEASNLPKKGSTVILGIKRKQSVWSGKMKKGAKMIVLDYDKMDGEDMLILGFADEVKKPNFDPEMDYQVVYLDEIK